MQTRGTLVETCIKLVTDNDEIPIDATLYKQIVESLRYVSH